MRKQKEFDDVEKRGKMYVLIYKMFKRISLLVFVNNRASPLSVIVVYDA